MGLVKYNDLIQASRAYESGKTYCKDLPGNKVLREQTATILNICKALDRLAVDICRKPTCEEKPPIDLNGWYSVRDFGRLFDVGRITLSSLRRVSSSIAKTKMGQKGIAYYYNPCLVFSAIITHKKLFPRVYKKIKEKNFFSAVGVVECMK